jgi:hypothetical protein
MAAPGRRLDIAGALIHRLWPEGAEPRWPRLLAKDVDWRNLRVEGLGRGLLVETWVNACLPVALASSAWAEEEVEAAWKGLPSPGTYGRLGALEGWLASGGRRPFGTAARLQGGLLLHGEYCTRGMCGNCPLS